MQQLFQNYCLMAFNLVKYTLLFKRTHNSKVIRGILYSDIRKFLFLKFFKQSTLVLKGRVDMTYLNVHQLFFWLVWESEFFQLLWFAVVVVWLLESLFCNNNIVALSNMPGQVYNNMKTSCTAYCNKNFVLFFLGDHCLNLILVEILLLDVELKVLQLFSEKEIAFQSFLNFKHRNDSCAKCWPLCK